MLSPKFAVFTLLLGLWAPLAQAQETPPAPEPVPDVTSERPKPKCLPVYAKMDRFELEETSLWDILKMFADMGCKNFVIGEKKELEGKRVTVLFYDDITYGEAWEVFMSALEVTGYSVIRTGETFKIVKAQDVQKKPGEIYADGESVPLTDKVVTQLLQLANISVNEITKIVQPLMSQHAKVIAYQPSNTLIITDSAYNLRKIDKLVSQLDVAAPQSTLEIVPISFADAKELKRLIEELYGTEEKEDKSKPSSSRRRSSSRSREPEPADTTPVSAGEKSKYISKVLADERTNSLIVLANETGHQIILDLVASLDIDTQIGADIHVVRLEHAKAEEVARVLSELSEGGRQKNSRNSNKTTDSRVQDARRRSGGAEAGKDGGSEDGSAVAAFDSGMRVAADENTNALLIIAAPQDFAVIKNVITQLDVVRRQVFVDAVIMEVSSQDQYDFDIGAHGPLKPSENTVGLFGATLGSLSTATGFSPDLLSGLAVGVFGEGVDVSLADGSTISVPAFGIALSAIKANTGVNIVSNPNLLTLDNEKAKITVGRKIPFPQSSQVSQFTGTPIVSFQREDVAITMDITPRVNSSNFVTLELKVEVQEIEEAATAALEGLSSGGGFVTSTREIETTALVKDNQTVVLGGLVGTTETSSETKIPILGDIPVLGALFRSTSKTQRKTNLMVFLTPHIIDDEEDMLEIARMKVAQRQEFIRRFYGRSQDQQQAELQRLLQYSMNYVDQPSLFRGPTEVSQFSMLGDNTIDPDTVDALQTASDDNRGVEPGVGAGELPEGSELIIDDDGLPEADDVVEPEDAPVEPVETDDAPDLPAEGGE